MSSRKILLIDYDPKSIDRVKTPLIHAGFEVEVAKDGMSGLAAFERTKPDLVLVEAMLPRKHGFEVCQHIKGSPGGASIPVLITSAVCRGKRYRTDALQTYGCDEYIEKPIPDAELVALCRRNLERAEQAVTEVARAVSEVELAATDAAEAIDEVAQTAPDLAHAFDELEQPAPEVAQAFNEVAQPAPDLAHAFDEAALPSLDNVPAFDEIEPAIPDIAYAFDEVEPPVPDVTQEITAVAPTIKTAPAPSRVGKRSGSQALDNLTDDELDERLDSLLADAEDAFGEGSAEVSLVGADPDASQVAQADALEPGQPRARFIEEDTIADRTVPPTQPPPVAARTTAGKVPNLAEMSEDELAARLDAVVEGSMFREPAATPPQSAAAPTGEPTFDNLPAPPGSEGPVPASKPPPSAVAEPIKKSVAPAQTRRVVAHVFKPERPERSGTVWMVLGGVAALLILTAGGWFAWSRGWFSDASSPVQSETAAEQFLGSAERFARHLPPEAEGVDVGPPAPAEPENSDDPTPAPSVEAGTAATAAIALNAIRPEPSRSVQSNPAPAKPAVDSSAEPPATAALREAERLAEQRRLADREEQRRQAAARRAEAQASLDEAASGLRTEIVSEPVLEPAASDSGNGSLQKVSPETLLVQPVAPPVRRGDLVEYSRLDRQPVIVRREEPVYDAMALRLRQEGTVVVRLLIDELGNVTEVELVEGIPKSRLNDTAMRTVRRWKYEPGLKDGVAVKSWKTERIVFKR